MLWTLLGWAVVKIPAFSLLGIGAICAWDWLVYQRIPYLKQRLEQAGPDGLNILMELIRIHRIEAEPGDEAAEGVVLTAPAMRTSI